MLAGKSPDENSNNVCVFVTTSSIQFGSISCWKMLGWNQIILWLGGGRGYQREISAVVQSFLVVCESIKAKSLPPLQNRYTLPSRFAIRDPYPRKIFSPHLPPRSSSLSARSYLIIRHTPMCSDLSAGYRRIRTNRLNVRVKTDRRGLMDARRDGWLWNADWWPFGSRALTRGKLADTRDYKQDWVILQQTGGHW